MTTVITTTLGQPGTIEEIPLCEIWAPSAETPLDEANVAQLMESIEQIGLMHPVQVLLNPNRGPMQYILVAGFHRFEAHARLGRGVIVARLISGDEVDLEIAQLEENLIRKNISVLQRAVSEQRLKALYEDRNRQARPGVAGALARHGQKEKVPSFTKWQAERLREHEKKVERRATIAKYLVDEVVSLLLLTPIANNVSMLQKLARQPRESQVALAKALVSGEIRRVSDALPAQRAKALTKKARKTRKAGGTLVVCDDGYLSTTTFLGRKVVLKIRKDVVGYDLEEIGPAGSDLEDRVDETPETAD